MEHEHVKCPRCGMKFVPREAYSRKAAEKSAQGQGYAKAFQPWSQEDSEMLVRMTAEGVPLLELAKALERQPTAIKRRMEVLNLQEVPVRKEEPAEPKTPPVISPIFPAAEPA